MMRKMLPEGAVRQKMNADGIPADDINDYFLSDPFEPASDGNFSICEVSFVILIYQ
jgi:hypothetical protein